MSEISYSLITPCYFIKLHGFTKFQVIFLCCIVKYCGEGFYKTTLTVDIPIQDKKRDISTQVELLSWVYPHRSNFGTHGSKILRAVCDRISILFRRKRFSKTVVIAVVAKGV